MKKFFIIANLFFFCLLFSSPARSADDALALTITPPLIKMNMERGQSLATSLTVVNNNDRPLAVFVKALDFKDKGNGGIEFLRDQAIYKDPEAKNIYLSQWISFNSEKIDLPPQKSTVIPFSISVPENAQPCGHYAALLVGTNPPEEGEKGAVVKISSYITSLILLKISGTCEEKGLIREFSSDKRIYNGGEVDFKVNFQNLGNVDIRPYGTIKIFDLFNKEKGLFEVNKGLEYGNVLPGGSRLLDEGKLKWSADDFFLINRYRAELSLQYGEQAKQSDFSVLYFWAINWKWVFIIFGSFIFFLAFLFFTVKWYVRQSVKNLQLEMGVPPKNKKTFFSKKKAPLPRTEEKNTQDIKSKKKEKVVDLRKK